MMHKTSQTPFVRANAAFRNQDIEGAIALYEEALRQAEEPLKALIRFNRDLAMRRLQGFLSSQSASAQPPPYEIEKPEGLDDYFFTLIQQSGFFDPIWYLAQYGEKLSITGNPLAHYLTHGVELSTNPSPEFNTAYYVKTHQDVSVSGMHPFLHYVCQGHREDRCVKPFLSEGMLGQYQVDVPKYLPRIPLDASPVEKAVRVIAFYLPQFHTIPENDAWWGTGFTEWTNVSPAKPLFEGHYQPHVPDDFLGYYDLRNTSVMYKQIELAKQYGIEGFCFYAYWFSSKRLLETPVDNYLSQPALDLPFCICWANENWSRRWDGLDYDLLMVQNYSDKDDLDFIANMAKYLRDPRYIRINGKPLLLVYRPNLFPSMKATAKRWREWCLAHGIGDIYLAYPQSFECVDPGIYGLDAAIEFPPNNSSPPNITDCVAPVVNDFQATVYDWRAFIERSEHYEKPNYTLFRAVNPGWDNTARKKNKSSILINSSPVYFQQWLFNAIRDTLVRFTQPDERLVFVNAWNEWAEGAHLEPDQRYGYAWLQAVRDSHKAALLGNSRHPTVLDVRWNKLAAIFGCIPDRKIYGFLVDYVALITQAVNKGVNFSNENNIPTWSFNKNRGALNTRYDFSKLSNCLYTNKLYCFVILQYNKSELTQLCVDSIKKLNGYSQKAHIVIVDNKSSRLDIEATNSAYKNSEDITLIFSDNNLGFSGGNNLGYKYAREKLGAKYIVVLNNDTRIEQPDFIEKTINLFVDYSYSIAGPDVLIPDGRHENPWNDYIFSEEEFVHLRKIRVTERQNYLSGNSPSFQKIGKSTPDKEIILDPLLQGAAFAISPIYIADHESLFDERLFLYGEEFLLATECLLSGHLTLYSSSLKVMHVEGATTSSLGLSEKMILGYDSAIKSMALCQQRLERNANAASGIVIKPGENEILDNLLAVKGPHVLIDLLFCQPGYHGGGEYGKAVFKKLSERFATMGGFQLWVAMNPNLFIDPWVWSQCKAFAVNIVEVRSYDEIIRLINTDRFDSFFTPAIVVYTGYEYMKKIGNCLPFTCKRTRVIGTLHDIRDFELAMDRGRILETRKKVGCKKEMSMTEADIENEVKSSKQIAAELRKMYQAIINDEIVDTLVTISQYCENSIHTNIGKPKKPMKVLMSPMKPRPKPIPFSDRNYDFSAMKYALLIHAGREEKNGASAVSAFDKLFSDYSVMGLLDDMNVVLTGVNSVNDVGLNIINHPGRFIALSEVPPAEFEYLLQHANFLVYPSFNEGLGYPPIEAMSYNTLCLVSNVTAIPEVCGDAVIYFDPYDINTLTAAILRAVSMSFESRDIELKSKEIIAKQASALDLLAKLITTSGNRIYGDTPF